MIHRLNIFLLSLLICFSPVYLMSKAFASTPKWVLEYIKVEKQVAEKKRLQALLIKQVNEAGSLTKTSAVVETVPTASKVGASMLKRVQHVARTPGGAAIGFYAVSQLLEGIGWVMEDGTYIKKKTADAPPGYGWIASLRGEKKSFPSDTQACRYISDNYDPKNWIFTRTESINNFSSKCYFKSTSSDTEIDLFNVDYVANPDPEPSVQKIPLTAALLGAAMLGSGYKDPVDSQYDSMVNTGNWTGVPEAYTPDPQNIGNELYNELEAKADKAPKTSDGKPAPGGDSRYMGDPSTNDTVNDRSWDDKGTKGDSTGSTTTDPETGEQTTNTEFNLPPFCSWAYTVCEWYEKWQKTDTKVNEHLDRTKEHQEEEKGFWQTVKDWFDWSKDDSDLPDRDDSDLDTSVEFEEKKVSLNVSAQCPAPTYETVSLHGVTAQVKTSDYSYICNLDWLIKPFVLGFSMVSACFILFGFQRGGDD